ncbi:hypothetical protein TraAM80_02463 [Trypanosoma rangeli]|uniref:Transmembrane protein n=1 Tax=Trypanosoma rangeli TaxID=5698 RepID=A0A422NTY5_TRYRA|nr:uncharacterized protein TraAM80_02463 [Trypanosoma rangeli]RNF08917.1 hypothetical protein TraAM80_02463 [Trypanosoma rangeli]|eukprot:RNF08917.1 hypothetical protein TraAM80_02463 [Trypanosoma rangeli]
MERVTCVLNEASEKTRNAAEAVVEGVKESGAKVNAKVKELMDVEKDKVALKSGTEKVKKFLRLEALKDYAGRVFNWTKQAAGKKVEDKAEPPVRPADVRKATVTPKQRVENLAPRKWYVAEGIALLVAVGVFGCVLYMRRQRKRVKKDDDEKTREPKIFD